MVDINFAFPPRLVIVADFGMLAIYLSTFSSSDCFFFVSTFILLGLLGLEVNVL